MASFGIWREDAPASIAGFDSQDAALAAVRAAIAAEGTQAVQRWALVRIPDQGDWETIAEGDALSRLAQARHLGSAA